MATVIVEIENSGHVKDIVAAMRCLKGVAKVTLQKEKPRECIPGLPYTDEERVASVRRSVEEYRKTGKSFSTEELRSKHSGL
jgi:hypothetical protein